MIIAAETLTEATTKTETRGGVRPNSGRKPGFVSEARKTGHKTKVARIPSHWQVVDIQETLEYMESLMGDARDQIEESRTESAKAGKGLNSRLVKLDEFLGQMEDILAGSSYKAAPAE